jgi:lactate dehydrogenase-like 2-hydroxyacid dehydrogenase
MKVICPTKNIFSSYLLSKFKKKFFCNFKYLNQYNFNKIAHNYEIIIIRFNRFISYKKNHKIRYILSPTTGEDHIDQKYFKDKKVKIFSLKNNIKFLNTVYASSEFTILLILMSLRKINLQISNFNNQYLIGSEIAEKKVGIIGLGRNGFKIAKIMKQFKAEVYYFDKKKKKNKYTNFLELNSLLQSCKIIVICIPLNFNKKFLNKSKLNKIKEGTLIVNTSRGGVLDENYAINLARKKKIFYTADVMVNEFSSTYLRKLTELNKLPNILITNHMGGLTQESIFKTDKLISDSFFKEINVKKNKK